MASLIQGDETTTGQMAREALPVAGVGAQTMEQDQRRIRLGVRFRLPFEVVEADVVAFEPSVNRRAHER